MATHFEKGSRVVLTTTVWQALREGKIAGVHTDLMTVRQAAQAESTFRDETEAETLAVSNRFGEVVSVLPGAITVKHDSGVRLTWQANALELESAYQADSVHRWFPVREAQDITGTFDGEGGTLIDAGGRVRKTADLGSSDEDFTTRRRKRRTAKSAVNVNQTAITEGRTWVVALSSLGRNHIRGIKGVRSARQVIRYLIGEYYPPYPNEAPEQGPDIYPPEHLRLAELTGTLLCGLKEAKEWRNDLSRSVAVAPGGSNDSLVPGNESAWIARYLTLQEAVAGLYGYWKGAGFAPRWDGTATEVGLAYAYDRYRGDILRARPKKGYEFEWELVTLGEARKRAGLVVDEFPTAADIREFVIGEDPRDPLDR